MLIIIVEDQEDQAEWLISKLREKYAAEDARVEHIRTESDFRARLPALKSASPSLFLIDVMLRWADPAPDMPARPREVEEAGFQRAGLRCVELLRKEPELRSIPVIIVSVLEDIDFREGEIPPGVQLITKELNSTALMTEIEAALAAQV